MFLIMKYTAPPSLKSLPLRGLILPFLVMELDCKSLQGLFFIYIHATRNIYIHHYCYIHYIIIITICLFLE